MKLDVVLADSMEFTFAKTFKHMYLNAITTIFEQYHHFHWINIVIFHNISKFVEIVVCMNETL